MWKDNLTGEALNIASTDASPLRVLAGPGTGKTFALKRRVARLIEQGQDANRILVCTFTRTAAQDLKGEVASLDVEGADEVEARTLHSLCFKILHGDDVYPLIRRVPRPLLTFEENFLREDMKVNGHGGIRDTKKKILAFNAAWATLQTDNPGLPMNSQDKACHDYLINWLKFHNAMLIGELIPLTLDYLRLSPTAEAHIAWDYVMVDEYQDLNKAEQVLIDTLSFDKKLVIIGDEDQSIYSFRYAHPEGITDFSSEHPDTEDRTLDVCRRCPTKIVDMSQSLIRANKRSHGRQLLPEIGKTDGEVYRVQWQNLDQEVEGICNFVKSRIDSGLVDPGEVLILCQSRKIAGQIRNRLNVVSKITCKSYFSEEELEGKPGDDTCGLQEAFSLLTLLANPEDRVALRCWCGFGISGLAANAWSRLMGYCDKTGESPFVALSKLVSEEISIPFTQILKRRFIELQSRIQDLEHLTGTDLIDGLMPEEEMGFSDLREMAKSSASFYKTTKGEEIDAKNLLSDLRERITQPEIPTKVDFVRVMSLYKSKGLSADLVIIASCVDTLLPRVEEDSPNTIKTKKMEEQRRVFYVGLTRAKKTLLLSDFVSIPTALAHQIGMKPAITQKNGMARAIASPFLLELGSSAPQPMTKAQFEAALRQLDIRTSSVIQVDAAPVEQMAKI